MTSKTRITVAVVRLLRRIQDRGRRAAIRMHHRFRPASSHSGDALGFSPGAETRNDPLINLGNLRDTDAQVLDDLYDILEGVYGEEAQTYFQRYIKLWPIYRRLKHEGVNVRISLGRFRQQPLLIVNGKSTRSDSKTRWLRITRTFYFSDSAVLRGKSVPASSGTERGSKALQKQPGRGS